MHVSLPWDFTGEELHLVYSPLTLPRPPNQPGRTSAKAMTAQCTLRSNRATEPPPEKAGRILPPLLRAFKPSPAITLTRSRQGCRAQRKGRLERQSWGASSRLAGFPSALQQVLPWNEKRRGTVPAGGGGTPVMVSASLLHEVSFAANDPQFLLV